MKFAFVVKTAASVVFSRKLLCNHTCTGKIVPFLIKRELQILSSLRSQQEAPAWGSKKHKNKQKLKIQFINIMADPKIEKILAPFRAAVKEQVVSLMSHCPEDVLRFFLFFSRHNLLSVIIPFLG